jgi:hypothetical protein
MHLSRANLSLPALPHFAKRKTWLTLILRIGATSCTLRMEREEKASKGVTLCCSPKEERETPREKANPKERVKESLERARKVIAKAKGRRERTLVA